MKWLKSAIYWRLWSLTTRSKLAPSLMLWFAHKAKVFFVHIASNLDTAFCQCFFGQETFQMLMKNYFKKLCILTSSSSLKALLISVHSGAILCGFGVLCAVIASSLDVIGLKQLNKVPYFSYKQEREPTTNSTHIWHRVRESNSGHIGGMRALSLLHHTCSPLKHLLGVRTGLEPTTSSFFTFLTIHSAMK